MPWYHFAIMGPDGGDREAAGSTHLPDDEAARRYALILIQELKRRGRTDRNSQLIVENGTSEVKFAIEF